MNHYCRISTGIVDDIMPKRIDLYCFLQNRTVGQWIRMFATFSFHSRGKSLLLLKLAHVHFCRTCFIKSLLAWFAAIPLFITGISINFINPLPFIINISNWKNCLHLLMWTIKKNENKNSLIRWTGGDKTESISEVFTSRNGQDRTRLLYLTQLKF